MSDSVITDTDLAERWHCGKREVHDMARAGRIAGFKVGRAWRFRMDVVIAYETADRTPAVVADFASRRRRAS